MGYVHQMDTAQLLSPWILDVTPLICYATLVFNTALAFYHSNCRRPSFTKIWHQGKEHCWERVPHVEIDNYLELVVCLVSGRCPVSLWVPWNCKYSVVPCALAAMCPGAWVPWDMFWELSLQCFWCCWFENSMLRPQCQRNHKAGDFSSFFSFSLTILTTLKMLESKKCRKIHTNLSSFFFHIKGKLDREGIREWIKIPQKEL